MEHAVRQVLEDISVFRKEGVEKDGAADLKDYNMTPSNATIHD